MTGAEQVLVDRWLLVVAPLLLLALVLLAVGLSTAARRLDRLHRRADAARAALLEQLVRRAAAADRAARSGLLDPAASVLLAAAAAEALAAGEDDGPGDGTTSSADDGPLGPARERAESELSAALRAALPPEVLVVLADQPAAAGVVEDLAVAGHRLTLARRFSNDAQVQVRRRRRGRLVRWARLAGRAPAPRTFEVDDAPPPGLVEAAVGLPGGPVAGSGGRGTGA
ncbi:hypothetical protein [Pseudokineococcus lusitanus]|uniref:Uncharacterized protein n=1 Tax=Pseudokineococcus lusitanus TaxID=763993 RepID=A0A3N1G8P8_9ACTN|nr:hypothetical protein [Pseudokineococcus lusitanus]ROP26596.1 hypothetical protein EDC03_3353 [Pseudokineococcus lusitanus]